MESVGITIRLFGAFRKFGNGSEIEISVRCGTNLKELRVLLSQYLRENDPKFSETLVVDSAIANDTKILTNDFCIEKSCTLAILPPVCGG